MIWYKYIYIYKSVFVLMYYEAMQNNAFELRFLGRWKRKILGEFLYTTSGCKSRSSLLFRYLFPTFFCSALCFLCVIYYFTPIVLRISLDFPKNRSSATAWEKPRWTKDCILSARRGEYNFPRLHFLSRTSSTHTIEKSWKKRDHTKQAPLVIEYMRFTSIERVHFYRRGA